MRRILLLCLAFLVLLPAAPAAARPAGPTVLVVGVPGLQWSDVGPQTPTLQRLASTGAVGVLSVKAVPAVSCPADGWLTLGAGNRAVASGIGREPCTADLPPPQELPELQRAQDDEDQGAELGALSEALDGCVEAGEPGPVLAAAGRPRAGGCRAVLRELPAVSGRGTGRAAAALGADRRLAALLRQSSAPIVLVVGLSAAPGEGAAELHVAIAHGPAFPPGALRSASTRRAPYVQLVDVAPTVLDVIGVPVPDSMTGQPWRSVGSAPSITSLVDISEKARVHTTTTVPFFVVGLALELALLAVALWRRPDLAELVALGGTAALGASYVANLVPWWRSPAPLLTLLAVVVLVSTAVVAVATSRHLAAIFALLGSRTRGAPQQDEDHRGVLLGPAGVVCGFTAGVLMLDLVTGAHLQMSSVAGYSPLVAGRFAGIGNVAFGVLAASALLATAALTRRLWAVAAVGVLVVAVDGAPPWGSDVGGVLALVPAFVLLGLLLSDRRVTWWKLLGAGAAGAVVVTAFALADWSRSEADRTHLGRFVQDVADGTAGTLLRRKADAVLDLLFTSPVTAALPVVVAAAVYLVVRPPSLLQQAFSAAPAWRAGLLALGLACAIGFAVNDSGAAIPALALVIALPATIAVVLRARRAPEPPASLLA